MSTDKKTSILLDQQLPQYVRENGPNLVAFLRAYYEWAEQANNAIEVSKNLINYQDLDTTYAKYLEYFSREIMPSLPNEITTNKQLLAKQIRSLYEARGSEKSYRFLFRLLYGEEIDFYYPGDDILRASDGRWSKETSIRVSSPRSGAISGLLGSTVTGATSGATGRVEKIEGTIERGLFIDELFLSEITGTFSDNEIIANSNNSITSTIYNTSGPLNSVTVTYTGSGHAVGDRVKFLSATGSGANGYVSKISDNSLVNFYIYNGGKGYTTGATIQIAATVGSGAVFTINSISNTEIIRVNTDTIGPMASVVINTGPDFVSLGANTASVSANLAIANTSTPLNAALAFSNTTVGTIASITTTSGGSGYSTLPTVTITQTNIANLRIVDTVNGGFKGLNADIRAENIAGSLQEIVVDNFGSTYNKYVPVTITNITGANTVNALGNPIISGTISYNGKYTDTKGWLSWNNKLQDNYYYQEFSYDIISDVLVNRFRNFVNAIVHPAGTKMFGTYKINETVDVGTTITIDTLPSVVGPESAITFNVSISETISANSTTSGTTITSAGYVDTSGLISNYTSEIIAAYQYTVIGDFIAATLNLTDEVDAP